MIQKTDYDIHHLGSFEQEWLLHKGCQDWWYATGYFTAEDGHRFSCQFTILNLFVGPLNLLAAMLALTDFGNERHRYRQRVSFTKKGLTVDENTIAIEGLAQAVREPGGLHIITHHRILPSICIWITEKVPSGTRTMDACINLSYFEELCSVQNEAGEEVGMCFTELFPHIYDDCVYRAAAAALLKNVEY